MPRPVPLRGVIEGFYGPPWSHRARLDAIEFLAARGMNAYVYAPKDDEKHRARWREAYDAEQTTRFRELAAACRAVETRFGFAISPGLDIRYGDDDDRNALLEKLLPLHNAGVDWFVLALDDIPNHAGLAREQAELARWLREQVDHHGAVRLSLVPTEYVGTHPGSYVVDLAAGLPDDVDVMWTGPTVCSPVVTAADAAAWRDALAGRPLLLWDNYPVNDSVMERELHLGPYRGREAELSDIVDGVLCNPMLQPRASLVALATAAEFLSDPARYDEGEAWERAIVAVGGSHAAHLRSLARACADGPLAEPDALPAQALVVRLADEIDGPGWGPAVTMLRDELTALRDASRAWRDAPDALGEELGPWLEQARREVDAANAALRLLQQVRPVATRSVDGTGRAAAPDAELALVHCFALLYAWMAAREAPPRVVLGPRFALHPAVVQLEGGMPGLDVDLTVHEDASVVDRLCRLALDTYASWARTPCVDLRIMTEAGQLAIGPDGAFAAPADAVVMIRSGSLTTRAGPDDEPPFSDPRFA